MVTFEFEDSDRKFQRCLFLEIRTPVSWLKIKMLWYTYLYENTMFTTKLDPSLFGKGKAWEAGWGKERKVLVLIKSLIYVREKRGTLGVLWKIDQSGSKM